MACRQFFYAFLQYMEEQNNLHWEQKHQMNNREMCTCVPKAGTKSIYK